MVLNFTELLASESARFRAVLTSCDPAAQVPTCPEWTADDLLWHLGDCHQFWATILGDGLVEDDQIEALVEPERPTAHAELLGFFDIQNAALVRAAQQVAPEAARWMWVSDDAFHHAGYLVRRQAQEGLIHRIDAELTAGTEHAAVSGEFAADGVDEALILIHGNTPAWGALTLDGRAVTVTAVDTGDAWTLHLGRFVGTSRDGRDRDLPLWRAERQVDACAEKAAAHLSGTALDLDLWLWGRGDESTLRISGDPAAVDHVRAVVADGVS
ncbi:maleylpyruvate isomerase N-terminal domain-containing protein [Dermacoccaceae bacterium W4C1]